MPNGDISPETPTLGITVVTQEAAQLLESAGDGPLGMRTDNVFFVCIVVIKFGF